MSRGRRLIYLAIAAVIAIVAVVVLVLGPEEARTPSNPPVAETATPERADGTATATPTATPRPRVPVLVQGRPRTLRFTEGERIRFRVRATQADHVHVHGYDLMKDVAPGQPVTFTFRADITGIFEVELEDSGVLLGNLRVDPA